jgi:N-acetylglucosamine kinase
MSSRLAIDSGSTRASYSVFVEPRAPQATGIVEGVNYTTRGREGLEALLTDISKAIKGKAQVDTVGLAIAGVGRRDVNKRALSDLADLLPLFFDPISLYLFHDGEAALWRALDNGIGIVVSAGTGSIVYGINEKGEQARCGGWGEIASDEGSAYWIAARAFGHIFRSLDGRDSVTSLSDLFLKKLRFDRPEELVYWLQMGNRNKEEVASLAQIVSIAADKGNLKAQEILQEAGRDLASMTHFLATRLSFNQGLNIGMTGTVLLESSFVRRSFQKAIESALPHAKLMLSHNPPETGVSLLLMDRIDRHVTPDLVF